MIMGWCGIHSYWRSSQYPSGITLMHHIWVGGGSVFLAALLGVQRLPWSHGCQGLGRHALAASTLSKSEDSVHGADAFPALEDQLRRGGQQESLWSSRGLGHPRGLSWLLTWHFLGIGPTQNHAWFRASGPGSPLSSLPLLPAPPLSPPHPKPACQTAVSHSSLYGKSGGSSLTVNSRVHIVLATES